MRPLFLPGVLCPYFLLVLGFTFIAISPRVISYAIPSNIVSTTVNKNGVYLLEAREPTLQSGLESSSTLDDALSTSLDLKPLPDSDPSSSSIGDDDGSTLSDQDIFSSAADSLSSTADSLLSTANALSSTADNLFSNDGSSPSMLNKLASTANSLSSTADVINSTADLLSSSSYDIYQIDDSTLGKDSGGTLLASGYEEPHCNGGVALCCNGLRILDGALVEHCEYCMFSGKPFFFFFSFFQAIYDLSSECFRLCTTRRQKKRFILLPTPACHRHQTFYQPGNSFLTNGAFKKIQGAHRAHAWQHSRLIVAKITLYVTFSSPLPSQTPHRAEIVLLFCFLLPGIYPARD